jgi:hypothetical protein
VLLRLLCVGLALIPLTACKGRAAKRRADWPDLTNLGKPCVNPGDCAIGLECMAGGAFVLVHPYSTCELSCVPSRSVEEPENWDCPPALSCAMTIDGPGNGRWRCQKPAD